MVNSSDLARNYKVVEENRIRQLVRQHEAQRQKSLVKDEFLPRAGIVGFLAGWFLMDALDNRVNNQ